VSATVKEVLLSIAIVDKDLMRRMFKLFCREEVSILQITRDICFDPLFEIRNTIGIKVTIQSINLKKYTFLTFNGKFLFFP